MTHDEEVASGQGTPSRRPDRLDRGHAPADDAETKGRARRHRTAVVVAVVLLVVGGFLTTQALLATELDDTGPDSHRGSSPGDGLNVTITGQPLELVLTHTPPLDQASGQPCTADAIPVLATVTGLSQPPSQVRITEYDEKHTVPVLDPDPDDAALACPSSHLNVGDVDVAPPTDRDDAKRWPHTPRGAVQQTLDAPALNDSPGLVLGAASSVVPPGAGSRSSATRYDVYDTSRPGELTGRLTVQDIGFGAYATTFIELCSPTTPDPTSDLTDGAGSADDLGTEPSVTTSHRVEVAATRDPDDTVLFEEGALDEVRLSATDGEPDHTDADRSVAASAPWTRTWDDLPPDDYALEAAVRPCSGSCDYLDAPTAACHLDFTLDENLSITVRFNYRTGCTITLTPSRPDAPGSPAPAPTATATATATALDPPTSRWRSGKGGNAALAQ